MFTLPEVEQADDRHHEVDLRLRYEDVAQDGRLRLEAAQVCMGESVWRGSLGRHPAMAILREAGIVPILRRFVVRGGDAPLSVHTPVRARGRWGFAAVENADRFLLDIRVDVTGIRGDTFGRPVERAGEREEVAAIYGEHVLTRLFAPPGERRVTELPAGLAISATRPWIDDDAIARIGAESLGRTFTFGLCHTDSNHHVNSLVYPRLFEELAIELWGDGQRLLRDLHIAWRKPCFAGETVRLSVRRAEDGAHRGVVGWVMGEGETRPRCVAKLWLRA